MKSPVVLILFNRPDKTEITFRAIAAARPSQLFLVADGPREGHPDDAEKCAAARAVVEKVDWDCEVRRAYATTNLGCGQRPASGISWVFEQTDRAIILEDDCVPHPSFFPFCDELLERYRDDERVMHICGYKPHPTGPAPGSYFFTKSPVCYGCWATWRRAWQHFDPSLAKWPEVRGSSWLHDLSDDARYRKIWEEFFETAWRKKGQVDYWDYQWAFAVWEQSGLAVMPRVNLATNIGFGPDATHTKDIRKTKPPVMEMTFPLSHPSVLVRDWDYDHRAIGRFMAEYTARQRRRLWKGMPKRLAKKMMTVFSSNLPDLVVGKQPRGPAS